MFKKNARKVNTDLETEADDTEMLIVLREVQKKVNGSPALNGGFEKLMFKVDSIEKSQNDMGLKIDSIHDAIYKPDTGLFARVAKVEDLKEKVDNTEKLEKKFALFEQHYEYTEQESQKESNKYASNDSIIKLHQDKIKELENFKQKFCSYSKWLMLTITGAIISLGGKLVYDILNNHVFFK